MSGGEFSTGDHKVSDVAGFPLEALLEQLFHEDERKTVRHAIELITSGCHSPASSDLAEQRP